MHNRYKRAVAALLVAITSAMFTACKVFAEDSSAVSVIAFPGTGNWPILIAKEKGSFVQNGIEVILSPTPTTQDWSA
jgi:ABC-type nitrate/sulfonate/bicarbonate transport system substrate-binding protein